MSEQRLSEAGGVELAAETRWCGKHAHGVPGSTGVTLRMKARRGYYENVAMVRQACTWIAWKHRGCIASEGQEGTL